VSLNGVAEGLVEWEGGVEREVLFVEEEVEELATTYGPSALAVVGSIYGVVMLTVILCETIRCLLGAPAFGAPDPEEHAAAEAMEKAKRPSQVGSVVSAML